MGGGKRGRTQRRHFKQNRENVWKKSRSDGSSHDDSATWLPFTTHNSAFEDYYKEQKIVPEEEWTEFLQTLRQPLPAAFRINSSGQFYEDIRSQLENQFMKSLEAEFENENEEKAIRPLPWYPDKLAWHSNFSRMQLRKNQTLERFHEFLKQENEIGNITRQEAVSMVPPLFLDVHPDHLILDMCAAPGSKTFQLLEIIHQSIGPGCVPKGLVIANDVDVQRCNLLIHQTKRMCSANLIVTNHEAQHFPGCQLRNTCSEKSKLGSRSGDLLSSFRSHEGSKEPMQRALLFDRVLCDVPCSGDGTLRKAPDIWRKWNAGMGNGLHCLQVQIAMRGLALLKVGGRMVYSTCSLNPVENEAVVAEVLRRCEGTVKLVDVSCELPHLVRRPGLRKWKVRDRGIWLASYKDVPKYRRAGIVQSMFPSGQSWDMAETSSDGVQHDIEKSPDIAETGSHTNSNKEHQNGLNVNEGDIAESPDIVETGSLTNSNKEHQNGLNVGEGDLAQSKDHLATNSCGEEVSKMDDDDHKEESSDLPLEYCMRILPHDQNSGAFFIAVLHKLSPLLTASENTYSNNRSSANRKDEKPNEVSDEMNPPEVEENKVFVEDPDASLSHEGTSVEPTDVCRDLDTNEMSSKDNDIESASAGDPKLEEAKACDDEKSVLEGDKGVEGRLQFQGKWRGVDPVVLFEDDGTINSIRNFYGVSDLFPLDGHLVTRNNDVHHVKRIYYISNSVDDVLKLNCQVGQQLKITSLGLKMFERQASKEGSLECTFRISSEGLPLLLPYISKQILSASFADFKHLLQYRTIKFADFVDAAFGEKALKLTLGCCVVVLNKGDQPSSETISVDASTIAIGCWKGRTNLCVMVSQMDCQELLERLSIRFGSGKDSSMRMTDHGRSNTNVEDGEGAAVDTRLIEDPEVVKE